MSSFSTYVAIVAEAHPERVGDMLAYIRLIIREASKFGGNGWLTYDSVFCHNQEGLSSPRNHLNTSLDQVYIATQRDKVAVPCNHCHEIDHLSSDCVVASVLPKTVSSPSDRPPFGPPPEYTGSKSRRPAPPAADSAQFVIRGMGGGGHMYVQTAMGPIQPQHVGSASTLTQPCPSSRPVK